jgi:hypothetical protein
MSCLLHSNRGHFFDVHARPIHDNTAHEVLAARILQLLLQCCGAGVELIEETSDERSHLAEYLSSALFCTRRTDEDEEGTQLSAFLEPWTDRCCSGPTAGAH